MPLAKPAGKITKPDALAIFTDRVVEREHLHTILSPALPCPVGSSVLLTQFYGVGGVGKSLLCRWASEDAAEFKDAVRLVHTSFDDNRWGGGSAFTEVSLELCRCLAARKIIPRLTMELLRLYMQRIHRSDEVVSGLEPGWEMAFSFMEKMAEGTAVPGLGWLAKGAQWARKRDNVRTNHRRLTDFGLLPEEQDGKLVILDLEKKLTSALYHDLKNWLKENPGQHVRLMLDGFERLQSSAPGQDSQRRLQEFIGYFCGSEERDACARFRVIIFGRDRLRWDEIYEAQEWRDWWNLHLLDGLAEADALDFLQKSRTWLASKDQSALAEALVKYEAMILVASAETRDGKRTFYPFYLNLAVELAERAMQSGRDLEFGRVPAELQDRFFRYLESRELRALMLLAFAEVFDEPLFDWLAKERLIEYPQHSFHSQLRGEHSYFQEIDNHPGEWKFHRLFEHALHARWKSTPDLKHEGAKLIKRMLDYYGAPLSAKSERNWTDDEFKLWRRGMEIIVTQGPELEILEKDEWTAILESPPWSINHFRCLRWGLDFARRVHKECERILGSEHQFTLRSIGNLASLLRDNGEYAEAESLYSGALKKLERILGPEHPDTLRSYNDFTSLLRDKGEYAEAEPLLRRTLQTSERVLGADHSITLRSVKNLANLLYKRGEYTEAETLYRRALQVLERIFGPEHPETLVYINNLASLLREKGEYLEAEQLQRRALKGRENVLGLDHPVTLRAVNNLANLLLAKGDYVEAEPLYRRALVEHERILGLENPSTLTCANNLAVLLMKRGEYSEAEPLLRRVLKERERVLGLDHPDTLQSVGNLASLYWNKKEYTEADRLFRRAVNEKVRVLGPEHPDTLFVVRAFASALKTKHLPEAVILLRDHGSKSPRCFADIRYDLACYECLSGNVTEAARLIAEEIAATPGAREEALQDDDLKAIHGSI